MSSSSICFDLFTSLGKFKDDKTSILFVVITYFFLFVPLNLLDIKLSDYLIRYRTIYSTSTKR